MDDEAALPVLSADKQETIFETVESLSHAAKDRLYAMGESSPWTARAVMQMLPALAQGVVLRLLCVDDPVDRADVEGWAAPGYEEKHRGAIRLLAGLRVVLDDADDDDDDEFLIEEISGVNDGAGQS